MAEVPAPLNDKPSIPNGEPRTSEAEKREETDSVDSKGHTTYTTVLVAI